MGSSTYLRDDSPTQSRVISAVSAMLRLVVVGSFLLAVLDASAQAPLGKRVALLIGNDKYRGTPEARARNPNEWRVLSNAVNDVRALEKRLLELGFDVIVRENRSREQMRNDIDELVNRAKGASGVLLYYSGHGAGINEINYLMPVDSRAVDSSLGEVHNDGIRLDSVVLPLMNLKGGTKIIMIDACRNMPPYIAQRSKSWGSDGGMARIPDPPDDTVIAFATDSGQTADDRPGEKNGLYAQGLLKALQGNDLSLARVLSAAEREVRSKNRYQRPKSYGSDATKEDFLFAAPGGSPGGNPVNSGAGYANFPAANYSAGPRQPLSIERAPDGTEMVALPYGRVFDMGSPPTDIEAAPNEFPQNKVAINHQVAIARTPVTRGQFAAFVNATGYVTDAERGTGNVNLKGCWGWDENHKKSDWWLGLTWRSAGLDQKDDHPVVCVSWNDATAYIAWLNAQAGLTRDSRVLYRLPNEAEWEYAARAGTTARYYWGDDLDHSQQCLYANGSDQTLGPNGQIWDGGKANCSDGSFFSTAVGKFKANEWLLADMLGNVWQWVEDCYDEKAYQGRGPWDGSRTAKAIEGCLRVTRGGSWTAGPRLLRVANRVGLTSHHRFNYVGFRIARTVFRP